MISLHRLNSAEIQPDFDELYRYAGFSKQKVTDQQIEALAKSAVAEVSEKMNCRSVFAKYPLQFLPVERILFAEKEIKSHHLMLNLHDCHSVYLFAATLGPGVDKLIQKESRINPAKSVMLQAAGAMFIERYCDLLQDFFRKEEAKNQNILRPRYSPGFGDVGLDIQKNKYHHLSEHHFLGL